MCSWFNSKIKKIAEQYEIDSSSPMGFNAVSATVQLQIYAQPIGCPNFFATIFIFGVYFGDMREYLNIIRSLFWMSEDGGPTSFTSEAKSEFLRGMERGEWQAVHLQCLSF